MEWRNSDRKIAWISPLLILFGAGLYPIYIWIVLKIPFWALFQTLDTVYQRRSSFPGLNLWYSIQNIFHGVFPLVNGPDLVFALLFIAGTVLVWKKLPVVYGIYTTAFMILYLCTNTPSYPLLSISRYVLVLFPVFFVIPGLVERQKFQLAFLVIMLAGLLFYSAQFALWGWGG